MADNTPTNTLVVNMPLSHVQIGGSNVFMSYSQGMNTSTIILSIELIAIPYNDN